MSELGKRRGLFAGKTDETGRLATEAHPILRGFYVQEGGRQVHEAGVPSAFFTERLVRRARRKHQSATYESRR